jgi:hypothetical protein
MKPTPHEIQSGGRRRLRHRLVTLMDTLARGAAPPGLIDMFPPKLVPSGTNALLRRRFTMIARFERNVGYNTKRWSATGVALSLLVTAVAFTGAVRGQSAREDKAGKSSDAAAAAEATPAAPEAKPTAPEAKPAAARTVNAFPPRRDDETGPGVAAELWNNKYRDRIVIVQGREANREQVERDFRQELAARLGSDDAAAAAVADLKIEGADLKAEPVSKPVPSGDVPTAEDRAMEAQLARRVPEVSFDAVALADAIDFLRDVSGANIFVDWKALEAAGMDRTTPVTLRAKNVSFSHALDMVLQSASGGTTPLAYSTKAGVIQISMGEQLDKDTEVRAYDVRDLVPAELEMKALVTMLQESVAPNSWRDAGGSTGVLHSTKHKLIVTTTEQNHREIRNVLKMLREEPKDGPKTEAAASTAARPAPAAGGQ